MPIPSVSDSHFQHPRPYIGQGLQFTPYFSGIHETFPGNSLHFSTRPATPLIYRTLFL
ncbi:MAG: hypothetical protein ABI690_21570 [Chloroflexota bacterium]